MLTFLFKRRCRVDLQTLAKWCIFMHEEHFLPNAGQSSFCSAWQRPQYMHAFSRTVAELACCLTALTSCWSETSLLYLSALSWIWQSWTALWRVRSLSLSSCFRKASDDTPQTILSRMRESFKVPNSQVSARIFSAVMKFWTGSDASWNLVLNLCRSMITLVSGLHSSQNFAFNTVTLSWLSAAWMMSPSSFLTSAAYVNVFAFSMVSLPARFNKIYALVRSFLSL